jgi:hypothetical protein
MWTNARGGFKNSFLSVLITSAKKSYRKTDMLDDNLKKIYEIFVFPLNWKEAFQFQPYLYYISSIYKTDSYCVPEKLVNLPLSTDLLTFYVTIVL